MAVAEGPETFNVQCILEGYLCLLKRFSFKVFIGYISFSFYVKYIWKKVLQELFWARFFWALIPFKRYQNTSGCGTEVIELYM